jgi:fumarate reductase subunit C
MLFFTDLGKAYYKFWMHENWFCICIVFIPTENATNFQSIAKRQIKYNQFYAFMERGAIIILR